MDKSEIYEIVASRDYATVVANAFRRACGIREVWVRVKLPAIVSADAYSGIMECFANPGSPMDGRW